MNFHYFSSYVLTVFFIFPPYCMIGNIYLLFSSLIRHTLILQGNKIIIENYFEKFFAENGSRKGLRKESRKNLDDIKNSWMGLKDLQVQELFFKTFRLLWHDYSLSIQGSEEIFINFGGPDLGLFFSLVKSEIVNLIGINYIFD